MADTSNLSNFLTDVATSIRNKKGTTEQILAANFDIEIASIETGSTINNQDKTITSNGTYQADEGYTGLGTVTVNVPQSGGDVPVKLFETVEQMNADTDKKDGDLAVVYGSTVANIKADTEFSVATFPKTVVLPTAVISSISLTFMGADGSSGWIQGDLSTSRFSMQSWNDPAMQVEYTSTDGITYIRSRFQKDWVDISGDTVDFGKLMVYAGDNWNDAIGYFIQVTTSVFDGLYKCDLLIDDSKITFPLISDTVFDSEKRKFIVTPSYTHIYDINKIKNIITKIDTDVRSNLGISSSMSVYKSFVVVNGNLCCLVTTFIRSGTSNITADYSVGVNSSVVITGELICEGEGYGTTGDVSVGKVRLYTLDVENETFTSRDLVANTDYTASNGSSANGERCEVKVKSLNCETLAVSCSTDITRVSCRLYNSKGPGKGGTFYSAETTTGIGLTEYPNYIYSLAQTQFTLSSPSQLLPDIIAYGKNGVVTGDGSITQPDTKFTNNATQLYVDIQEQIDNMEIRVLTDDNITTNTNIIIVPTKSDGTPLWDTSQMTSMQDVFNNCKKLKSVANINTSNVNNTQNMFANCSSLTRVPQLDTSKVTNMTSMFYNCLSLTNIPQLDTSKATSFYQMFYGCSNLVTISPLNTSNATNMEYMFYKCLSLTTLDLSSFDTSKVTALSYMFNGCKNLTTLNLSSFNTSKVTITSNMFNNCTSLTELKMDNFDPTNITSYSSMFKNVPTTVHITTNQTMADWMTSNFPTYTNMTIV